MLAVAILPQLFMLQRTGEAETITTHYLFALGAYRALYIPNWIYRYIREVPKFYDPIAVIAGVDFALFGYDQVRHIPMFLLTQSLTTLGCTRRTSHLTKLP